MLKNWLVSIFIIGLGIKFVSSDNLVPNPPHKIKHFIIIFIDKLNANSLKNFVFYYIVYFH